MNQIPDFNFIEGEVLLFNKALQWTSFDVVNKVRRLITQKTGANLKVGHAGTLDPLADGLLIICTGKKTKQITQYQETDKEYIATIQFGSTTPSFDLETEINATYPSEHITLQLLTDTLQQFTGKQQQTAIAFSAKKVNGKRAYEKARKGIEVVLKPSDIEIKEIELLNFNFPACVIRVVCTKGTYIRSLARDLGTAMQSGAHLTALTRTKSGQFTLNQAMSVTDFETILNVKYPKVVL